jgi:hypothetical protein
MICFPLWSGRTHGSGTYKDCGVAGCKGKDVGAGDGAGAGSLKGSLDLVDDLKPPEGIPVGVGPFLTNYAAAVIQQHGRIASLHTENVLVIRLGKYKQF